MSDLPSGGPETALPAANPPTPEASSAPAGLPEAGAVSLHDGEAGASTDIDAALGALTAESPEAAIEGIAGGALDANDADAAAGDTGPTTEVPVGEDATLAPVEEGDGASDDDLPSIIHARYGSANDEGTQTEPAGDAGEPITPTVDASTSAAPDSDALDAPAVTDVPVEPAGNAVAPEGPDWAPATPDDDLPNFLRSHPNRAAASAQTPTPDGSPSGTPAETPTEAVDTAPDVTADTPPAEAPGDSPAAEVNPVPAVTPESTAIPPDATAEAGAPTPEPAPATSRTETDARARIKALEAQDTLTRDQADELAELRHKHPTEVQSSEAQRRLDELEGMSEYTQNQAAERARLNEEKAEYDSLQERIVGGEKLSDEEWARYEELDEDWKSDDARRAETNLDTEVDKLKLDSPEAFERFSHALQAYAESKTGARLAPVVAEAIGKHVKEYFNRPPEALTYAEQKARERVQEALKLMQLDIVTIMTYSKQMEALSEQQSTCVKEIRAQQKELKGDVKPGDTEKQRKALRLVAMYDQLMSINVRIISLARRANRANDDFRERQRSVQRQLGVGGMLTNVSIARDQIHRLTRRARDELSGVMAGNPLAARTPLRV